MTQNLSTPNQFSSADLSDYCSFKNPADSLYQAGYFVSNETCPNLTSCLGTKENPFDSIMTTIFKIHNDDLAEKYLAQNINIYLLGSPHYIKNSEIPYTVQIRLFRRMNATIVISPWFCENENIPGCCIQANGESADIILKTFMFNFEIHNYLTIININFFGNDIVLNTTSEDPCYNTNVVCCDESSVQQSINTDDCGLSNRTLNLDLKSNMNQINGLFNLKLLYDDDLSLSPETTPNPSLNLKNVGIYFFYSVNTTSGWVSLISFGTLGYDINMENVTLENTFFQFGILYFSSFDEDPYFSYIPQQQIEDYYTHYSGSGLFNSTLLCDNIIIDIYNDYSFQITSGYQGSILNLINLYQEQNKQLSYIFQNMSFINIQMDISLYAFSFFPEIPDMSNAPLFNFSNLTFYNNLNLLFLQISACNVLIDNISFENSEILVINFFMFDFSVFGSIFIQNSNFFNCSLNNQFILSAGFNVTFQNTIIEQFQNAYFEITSASLSFLNVQYLNSDNSFAFISAILSNLTFESSMFSSMDFTSTIMDFIEINNTSIYWNNNQFNYLFFTSTNFISNSGQINLYFENNTFIECQNLAMNLNYAYVKMNNDIFEGLNFQNPFFSVRNCNISILNITFISAQGIYFIFFTFSNFTLENSHFINIYNMECNFIYDNSDYDQPNNITVLNTSFDTTFDMAFNLGAS